MHSSENLAKTSLRTMQYPFSTTVACYDVSLLLGKMTKGCFVSAVGL